MMVSELEQALEVAFAYMFREIDKDYSRGINPKKIKRKVQKKMVDEIKVLTYVCNDLIYVSQEGLAAVLASYGVRAIDDFEARFGDYMKGREIIYWERARMALRFAQHSVENPCTATEETLAEYYRRTGDIRMAESLEDYVMQHSQRGIELKEKILTKKQREKLRESIMRIAQTQEHYQSYKEASEILVKAHTGVLFSNFKVKRS